MGAPPRAPTSARRLPAMQPMATPGGEMTPRSSDLLAVSVNEDTLYALKKKSNTGWLWATLGGVATVGLIVFLLMKFGRTTEPTAPAAPPAEVKTAAAPVPPPEPKADPPPATTTVAKPPTTTAVVVRRPTTPVSPPPTPPPPTATVTTAPPPPPQPTHTTPAPKPTATHEKNEVF